VAATFSTGFPSECRYRRLSFLLIGIALVVGFFTDLPQGGIVSVFPEESGQTTAANLRCDQFTPIQALLNRRFQCGKSLFTNGGCGADVRRANECGLKLAVSGMNEHRESHGRSQFQRGEYHNDGGPFYLNDPRKEKWRQRDNREILLFLRAQRSSSSATHSYGRLGGQRREVWAVEANSPAGHSRCRTSAGSTTLTMASVDEPLTIHCAPW
jgi:hypothetical protein